MYVQDKHFSRCCFFVVCSASSRALTKGEENDFEGFVCRNYSIVESLIKTNLARSCCKRVFHCFC